MVSNLREFRMYSGTANFPVSCSRAAAFNASSTPVAATAASPSIVSGRVVATAITSELSLMRYLIV